MQDVEEPSRIADIIAFPFTVKIEAKTRNVRAVDIKERLNMIVTILNNEKEVIQLEKKIGQRVKRSMERTQKEYYLREQMKAIQKELGDKEGKTGEVGEAFVKKIEKAGMPEHVYNAVIR